MKTIFDDVTWKEQDGWEVKAEIHPSEPAAGILGPHMEILEVKDPSGQLYELQEGEDEELVEMLFPALEARYYGGEDY